MPIAVAQIRSNNRSSSNAAASSIEELINDDSKMRQRLVLRNGRTLSYSESGDPNGDPVLFHMGLMASSLGVVLFHEEALKLNLRMLAIDYPGIGDSTPWQHRTISDWPVDVEEFCTAIFGPRTQVSILAHSMGGPHALACLTTLPHRVARATLVSPWLSPFFAQTKWPTFLQESIIPRLVTTTTSSTLSMVGSVSSASENVRLTKQIVEYSGKQGQEGNRCMVSLAIGESLQLPETPWFPIYVYCGTKDHLVSEESCKKLVDTIGGTYTAIEGADHNSVMGKKSMPEILATLKES